MRSNTCPSCHITYTNENAYESEDGRRRCRKCTSMKRVETFIRKKVWAVELMGGKCVDCNGVFPYQIYSFHHLDPSQKDYDWKSLKKQKEKTVLEELQKCVMLCMNCHAIRHIDMSKNLERILDKEYGEPKRPKTSNELKHGLDSTYNHHKCRCELCVGAHNKKIREYRKKRVPQKRSLLRDS